jgi:UDP-hydrolysing UDP-N-acetyl-D-glucosamine 2-epimerase
MKVALVSGSRADYGLLRPTLAALRADPRFEPCLLVTAMHLDPRFGETVAEMEADGNTITARVPAGSPPREAGDFARNIGRATIAFCDALAGCEPDILLVLGDRFEVLSAALAASALSIPVAHIHGGELSEGSLDDAMRHCITKLSHLHFTATRTYAERVCQLGEDPARVHVVGATGIEAIRELELLDRGELAAALAIEELSHPLVVLTLHPESLRPDAAGGQAQAVTEALDDALPSNGCVVVTLPNDDPGGAAVRETLVSWGEARTNVHVFANLGQLRYLSLLDCADAVLGNSSSALIEAPSFRLPVVNVGERQRGRMMAANILNAPPERAAVGDALRKALDSAFRRSLEELENPHDQGNAAEHILAVLGELALEDLSHKRFFDLPDLAWRRQLELGDDPPAAFALEGASDRAGAS